MPCQDCRELLQVECFDLAEIRELVARADGSQVHAADRVVNALQGEHQFDGCYPMGTVCRTVTEVSSMPVWRSGDEFMTLAQAKTRDLTRRHPFLQDEPQFLNSITSHCEKLIRELFGGPEIEHNLVRLDRAIFNRLEIACEQHFYQKIGEIRPDGAPMYPFELHVALSRSWQSYKNLVTPSEWRLAKRALDIYGPTLRDTRAQRAFELDCKIVASSSQFGCAYYEQVQWSSALGDYAIPVGMHLPKSEFTNPKVRKDQLTSRMNSGMDFLVNNKDLQTSYETWQDIKRIFSARSAILLQINHVKDYLYNITDIVNFKEINYIFGIIPIESIA